MFKYIPTLTDFILDEQRTFPNAKGNFSVILHLIENASKTIASHIKASGLIDIIGKTGDINSFGEEVQKLDQYTNSLLVNTLLASGTVKAVVSEELAEPVYAAQHNSGDYIVFFDPLDGSSNIDTNCPIGTIFSIYHQESGLLQAGSNQVAAGYIIYGSSVMFVYTSGNGVNGFTLDPAVGNYLLSHPKIQIPKKGNIYSINEGYEYLFSEQTKKYLSYVKQEGKSRSRYVGSLVADAHRTFLKGGIFLYPEDKKQPEGKLRLLLEVNPFAFLTEQAGGKALGKNGISPLIYLPEDIHARSPFIMGSKDNVDSYQSFS